MQCVLQMIHISRVLLLLGLIAVSVVSAVSPCRSSACMDLFSAEFDVSRLACNYSAPACSCRIQVLDLTACAAAVNGSRAYDLTVLNTSSTSSNKYTAPCKDSVLQQGQCSLAGVEDRGFQISSFEIICAALGVACEIMSGYQIVRRPFQSVAPCLCSKALLCCPAVAST